MFKLPNLKNLLGTTFTASRVGGEFLLRETNFGKVYIESDTIRQMVERTRVKGVHEIRNVDVEMPDGKRPLQIKLSLIIAQNHAAPVVGANLRDAVKSKLQDYFNIKDARFDIKVTQISQSVPEKKKRRVR